ncbi:MAG: asparagine synthase (glutamine-hydrolyzing), partial [Gammaproteobacteria bacterium]|nr:asparagine synthase (glutamine-hydrolyzing) [Gammaproteobacteria bacterium]
FVAADGQTWIVFNGEIYGFRRLRKELEARGHRFRTESDTEVLLEAFLEWGQDFIDHIDGMFAIAIWDQRRQQLHLYRDRPGIKPLYYFYDGTKFAFASELKAIEQLLPSCALVTDPTALYDFLGYRYVPAPKTQYRNCYKMLPGHRLTFSAADRKLGEQQAYWQLPTAVDERGWSVDTAAEELKSLIAQSVRDQMIADVPLGFFLSGGLDSSVVVASAALQNADVATFSIGFDSDEASETPYARQVAERFGTKHVEKILTQSEAADLLPRLKSWFDEPFADESALPTYLVSRTAREHVTVVLTGDGGDEVFGGYNTYQRYARYAEWPSWPQAFDRAAVRLKRRLHRRSALHRVVRVLETGFSSGIELWSKIMVGMPAAAKAEYRTVFGVPDDYDDWWHFRRYWRDDLPLKTRLQYLDFHTFMHGSVLTKVDRTSMAVSLEARVPLLARNVIEFSFSLAEDVRLPNGEAKGLLRHAYRDVLPPAILQRRKKGFGIPQYYFGDLGKGIPLQEHILHRLFLEPRQANYNAAL